MIEMNWNREERDRRFFEHVLSLRNDITLEQLKKLFSDEYSTYNYRIHCSRRANSPNTRFVTDTGCIQYNTDEVLDNQVLKMVEQRELEHHYDNELQKFDAKSWEAGRCYYQGVHKVSRKDGAPLTDLDISAIKAKRYGQDHVVTVSADNMYAAVNWSCDSSD